METLMRIAGENTRPLAKRINFTVASLDAATCPPGRDRIIIYDGRVPGLALRITAKGAKSFTFYRKHAGRPVKMMLGSFPGITIEQARQLAAKANGESAQGIDPTAVRRSIRQSMTLQELFDRYTTDHAKARSTKRTLVSDESRFDTCFEGWKSRKLATIRAADVRTLHSEIGRARGQVSANRAVQLLRRLFNWARLTPNPAAKGEVEFFRETERERFVQADELPRFFKALEAEPNETIRDFVKLALWTGARRSNVASMRWDEVNIDAATWKIPAGKSKNASEMQIHLSPPALAILEARKGNKSEHVFPGTGKSGHLEEPKKGWKRILESADLKDLHLHDLRRTLGSWQAATGASLPIIGKSLGHKNARTTQIYARLNLDPVRQSVNTATTAMLAAMKPTKAKRKTNKRK